MVIQKIKSDILRLKGGYDLLKRLALQSGQGISLFTADSAITPA